MAKIVKVLPIINGTHDRKMVAIDAPRGVDKFYVCKYHSYNTACITEITTDHTLVVVMLGKHQNATVVIYDDGTVDVNI